VGHKKSKLSILILCATLAFTRLLTDASEWRISAAAPSVGSPKRSSSAIALTPAGQLLLAVNPDSNSLTAIDTNQSLSLAEIPA
jgi:DNA-binding beta-propeller fold protein YncE